MLFLYEYYHSILFKSWTRYLSMLCIYNKNIVVCLCIDRTVIVTSVMNLFLIYEHRETGTTLYAFTRLIPHIIKSSNSFCARHRIRKMTGTVVAVQIAIANCRLVTYIEEYQKISQSLGALQYSFALLSFLSMPRCPANGHRLQRRLY